MPWIPLAAAAIGAVSQSSAAASQRKAQEDANKQAALTNAAQTEFSPWTGINPQGYKPVPVTGDPMGAGLGGAVQGALGGVMFGQGMDKHNAELAALKAQQIGQATGSPGAGQLMPATLYDPSKYMKA